jgi:hypothetical protein
MYEMAIEISGRRWLESRWDSQALGLSRLYAWPAVWHMTY